MCGYDPQSDSSILVQYHPYFGVNCSKAVILKVWSPVSGKLEKGIRKVNCQLYPRPTEPGILRMESAHLCFDKPINWFRCSLIAENHCFKEWILPRLWLVPETSLHFLENVSQNFVAWDLDLCNLEFTAYSSWKLPNCAHQSQVFTGWMGRIKEVISYGAKI